MDRRYCLSFDPETTMPTMPSGLPDWSGSLSLLRILAHDDLYRRPRQHSADDHSLLDHPTGNQARLPSASLAVSRQAAASHCSSSWAAAIMPDLSLRRADHNGLIGSEESQP